MITKITTLSTYLDFTKDLNYYKTHRFDKLSKEDKKNVMSIANWDLCGNIRASKWTLFARKCKWFLCFLLFLRIPKVCLVIAYKLVEALPFTWKKNFSNHRNIQVLEINKFNLINSYQFQLYDNYISIRMVNRWIRFFIVLEIYIYNKICF